MWGDAHRLEFSNETFGTVYTNVLDHILHTERFADEAHRVLQPNGTLFLDIDENPPDEWTVHDLRRERQQLEAIFRARFDLDSKDIIRRGEEKDAPKHVYVFRKKAGGVTSGSALRAGPAPEISLRKLDMQGP